MLQAYLVFLYFLPQFYIQPESGSFSWEMVLETKIWVLGVLVATGVSFLLGPLIRHSRKYMCVYKPMYIHLPIHVSLCNHVYHIKLNMSVYGCLLLYLICYHQNEGLLPLLICKLTPTVRRKLAPTICHPFT